MNFGNLQGQLGGLLGSLTGKQQQQQQQAPYGQYPGQQAQQPYQPQYGQYPGPQAQQQYPGQPQTSYGLPYQQQPPQQGFPHLPPSATMLPPGWIAQWNAQYQRNFINATGKSNGKPQRSRLLLSSSYGICCSCWTPPGSSVGAPGEKVTLADHYNLNAEPGAAPFFRLHNSSNKPAVGTVDPTVAIALELSQHVPSLMKAPPAGSKPEVLDGWRRYLREIQDAQTNHTRAIRDAQIEHDRRITNMGYAVQSQVSHGQSLQQQLDDAQIDYNRTVEHAHQTMNDQVERAKEITKIQQQMLPPGWIAQWNTQYQRNFYVGAAPILQTSQQQQQGNPLLIPANAAVEHHSDHTRDLRDAQVDHDRRVKDAHYQDQQFKLNSASSALSSLMKSQYQ
ncbi:hypothetical protein BCR33DRAFT_846609 [Rhizoclosmatium globosum]|uniref:Uncharacterized protein n=1 Tax=Rhizoclosmatium globosum TaxID=329046 RepID=A0A1Y2CVA1_9FUNG|nr:hypothetical protein BCR33DRAFT_846609 [Rhizoclosmatium globosum]|eukprot:ORY50943.1 hypothetical protein BCR33DRAFT_846609 [Rhizoclosmatium globosum]